MINKFIVDEKYYKENDERILCDFHGTGGLRILEFSQKNDYVYIGRKNGPAFIEYHICGNIIAEKWVNHETEHHRINGPAIIRYNYDGTIQKAIWYHKDNLYTLAVEDWLKHNKLNWQEMNKEDFDRMWFEVLD